MVLVDHEGKKELCWSEAALEALSDETAGAILTRESQNTQLPGFGFRALLTEDGDRSAQLGRA
jgi:hypothetical protein